MPKFKVYANSKQTFSVEVEADDVLKAFEKAKYQIDGGDFTPINDGDWEVEVGTIERLSDWNGNSKKKKNR